MANTTYETVIGLEAHVQLATESKAFCADRNQFGSEPNRNISMISLGYPGTLPMLNEQQVRFAVKLGLALGCKINKRSTFDRKNYFYADLPKGYQITQDENPICLGGGLPLRLPSTAPAAAPDEAFRVVQLHHIHMEEDAGKSIHAAEEPYTKVDLNRAGTPLLEIVTEPDLRSAEEVDAFMNGMRRLVRWLGVSDGNMQEGSLRCDVNISVRPEGQTEFGTRCEIKNMNSMKFARQAVSYEVERQIGLLENGESVRQQTRQFDPASGTTAALRDKEDAHDYRYFPDPDLPPVVLSDVLINEIRAEIGVLPWQAYGQLIKDFGLDADDAHQLSEDRLTYHTFLAYAELSPSVTDLAKLWVNRIAPWLNEEGLSPEQLPLTPDQMAQLQEMVLAGDVAAAAASSKLLPSLLETPGEPMQRAEDLGLIQNNDADFLSGLVDAVIDEFPDKVAAYQKGKKGLIGFFMGEVMKRSKGSAEPKETNKLLRERLG
ncbi:Asp-tRNA(Asn)/Glu-tRNA(Gln) amidotransferase subunit GatB [Neolewinella agarilytica]|uniref:Aspartyl/glutamyl-tRNA(Asn/Gln) amidotransferase subunit B n=1 Tax=Neolewinella agarilytica TaxID=478744 RepID=A0A1H9EBA0_9BACT|nr:Asp-tRNA(Asn)/Glu-tRNA(Gln) amidotransferase subunit GatB [Neolewinella agarilytica]SEQ23054.1 aspartyl/glutamyl-tRNA(Asn/Gln) amidotransferase subunit B [Neolewinella agarilytica]